MSNEPAGRADKEGNRYEYLCVIDTILDLVSGKIVSFKHEPIDEDGVDITTIEKSGIKNLIQCKSRNSSKDYWRFSDLKKLGCFDNWKYHLDRDVNNKVALYSPLPFMALTDLTKRALNSDGDIKHFYEIQVGQSSETRKDFNKFCECFHLNESNENDVIKAQNYLKRLTCALTPDFNFKATIKARIERYFIGNSDYIFDCFLEWIINGNIMGNNISIADLYSFLSIKNIILRSLENDKNFLKNIDKLNKEYKAYFEPINNKIIQRKELESCINSINNGESIVIHGDAGCGKSGLTNQIINYLEDNNILYLALKLDEYIPQNNINEWSEKLGFHDLVSNYLNAFSNDKNCVLILDQLDAIGWTQNNTKNAIGVISDLLNEINNINKEREIKISVVLVIRTFDLENDYNMKKIINKDWLKIKVDKLDDGTVRKIINNDSEYNGYNKRLKQLLRISSNLYIWTKIYKHIDLGNIFSTGDLINEWWRCIEEDGYGSFDSNSLNNARDTILKKMQEFNTKSIKKSWLKIDNNILSFLCSKGFIVDVDSRISFSHQSIVDYYSVKEMIINYNNGSTILDLIGTKDKQFPMIRYRLQMFLEEIYDGGNVNHLFTKAVKEILGEAEVRFYIKYVVFEILGNITNLDDNLEKFLLQCIENDEYIDDFIGTVFMSHPVYIDFLITNGFLKKWLFDSEKNEMVFTLLKSVNTNFADLIVNFIDDNLFVNNELDKKFLKCLPYDISFDSDNLFDLRLKLLDRYDGLTLTYIDFNRVLLSGELRAVKLLAFLLKSKMNKGKKILLRDEIDFDVNNVDLKNDKAVLNELLPLLPKYRINDGNILYYWTDSSYNATSIERITISLIKKAILNLIKRNYKEFFEVFNIYFNQGYEIYNELILYGLLNMPLSESKTVLSYLFSNIDNNIFEKTSGNEESITLVKDIIKKFCNNLTYDDYKQFEDIIMSYKPLDMIDRYKWKQLHKISNLSYWGDLQFELLKCIPEDKLTAKAKDLLKVLNRKFNGRSHAFENFENIGGLYNISFPIANKNISDKSWINLLSNKKLLTLDKTIELKKDNILYKNSLNDAQMFFSENIHDDPIRFINLVLKYKTIILDEFVDTLFQSLANFAKINELDNNLLEKLFFSFDNMKDIRIRSICEIVSKKENSYWSNSVIKLIKDYFNKLEHEKNYKLIDEKDFKENSEIHMLNSVIGKISLAIKKILIDRQELYSEFKPIINTMTQHNDDLFRFSSLYVLIPCLKIDREWTVEKYVELFSSKTDWGFRYTRAILFDCYNYSEKHKNDIEKMIISGLSSNNKLDQKSFAYLLFDLYIWYNDFSDCFKKMNFSIPVLNYILEMAIAYLSNDELREKAKTIIVKILDIPGIEFNPYSIFKKGVINLDADELFILQICEKTGYKIIESFSSFINKESSSLLQYNNLIISIGEIIIGISSVNNDMTYSLINFSNLLVRLFDEAYDNEDEIKIKCMDLWDKIFMSHIISMKEISDNISDL